MKRTRRKELEDLSAYLDEESTIAPDVLQSMLRDDAELSTRHAQWAKISQAMRTMPETEVHPAFRTRTMAAIREIEPAPKTLPWRWPALGGAVLAACALAVVYLSNSSAPSLSNEPAPDMADASAVETVLTARLDASTNYISELELEYGVDVWEVDDSALEKDPTMDLVPSESVSELSELLALFESAVTDDQEVGAIVDSVDAPTALELRSLMLAYADEELYL